MNMIRGLFQWTWLLTYTTTNCTSSKRNNTSHAVTKTSFHATWPSAQFSLIFNFNPAATSLFFCQSTHELRKCTMATSFNKAEQGISNAPSANPYPCPSKKENKKERHPVPLRREEGKSTWTGHSKCCSNWPAVQCDLECHKKIIKNFKLRLVQPSKHVI